jgi:hypothetical protein
MMTPPSADWSVFKQIFADHWDEFQHAHPRYQTSYYDGLVAKMLACGHPEKMGYIAYRCWQCGQGQQRVSMSCKSSLCLRCAKVYIANWVSQGSQILHAGVIYRHIILTVLAMFRGQVVGIHIADEVITDGIIDVHRVNPLARLGYTDYAKLGEVFTMHRPE